MGQWMDIWSLLGCFMYYLLVCFSFLGLFLVWGSAFPFYFYCFIFCIFGESLVSGSVLIAPGHIALLEGVCWNFRRLCEHVQCARSPDSRYIPYLYCSSGYFAFTPFYFVVYSIYTRTCIIATHLFVLWRDQGQPEIISFILSRWCDLANEYAYRFDFNTERCRNLASCAQHKCEWDYLAQPITYPSFRFDEHDSH